MTQARVVLITAPNVESAGNIAKTLVEEKLAACVNIVPGIRSIYLWEGKICDDSEVLMIAKTTAERFPDLQKRVQGLHSYETPEIISLPIEEGSAKYLRWIIEEVDQS